YRRVMIKTPSSLLQRLRRSGDAAAWERFVDLYTPLLYFWACRMGVQAQDAADLVQEVFATLLQKLPEFDYDKNRGFRAWLRTVTVNKWRDNRRRHGAALRGGNDAGLDELAVPDAAEALWDQEFRQHLVGQALEIMRTDFQPATWQAFWGLVVEGRPAAAV